MRDKSVRVGLVGLGRISKRHIDSLSELTGYFELVAGCDPDPKTHDSSGLKHCYLSLAEMLTHHDDIQLVVVLAESGSHAKIAKELVFWGKPVLIEKPLTLSLKSALEITDVFKEAGIPLWVVKQNRLNPAVKYLLDMVRREKLGKVQLVTLSVLWCRTPDYYRQAAWRLSRALDGGVVWNQASHYVDLIQLVAGPISVVKAYGANFASPAETEDTVIAIMKTLSGALVHFAATTTIRPKNFEGSLLVSGSDGYIKVGGHALNEIVASSFDHIPDFAETGKVDISDVYGSGHSPVYMEIYEDLMNGTQSQFRAEFGLDTVALMETIERSILDDREVLTSETWGELKPEFNN